LPIATVSRGSRTGLDFRLHLVQRAPLFRGLDAECCGELVRLARDVRVARRERFFDQGDPACEVLVLCAGRVKLTHAAEGREQVILRVIVPGEVFGAIDVVDGGAYPLGAQALEASHALVWNRCVLDALAARQPILLRNVVRILGERLRSLEQSWRDLATVRVPQRVAGALTRLAVQIGRTGDGGTVVALGREDLAQMTGTTPFTVSRLLSEWEARGYVQSRREAVVVLDATGLARHAVAEPRGAATAGE
jgi:CRP-like cAMP-binding protein